MGVTTTFKLVAGAIAIGAVGAGALAAPAAAQDADTIAVTSIDLVNDTIVITNSGTTEVDVNGLILCNFPAYAPIEGADPIPAGGTITVDAGAHGIDLADDQGEMGIYNSNQFEDPDALLTYVEWGTADHQRSSVAVAAGIWDGNPVPAADTLTASVDNPTSSADWGADAGGSDDSTETTAAPVLAETGAGTWLMGGIAAALLLLGLIATQLSRRRAAA